MKPRQFRADLLPKIRDLEVEAKQQVLSALLSGEWISRIQGHGIEFAGYRQYTSGDDASRIDWKASLRSRRLVVKELQEEKSLSAYIFLDVSDTMLFGTTDKAKAEYAAELTSTLAYAMLHVGENVSLAMWSDRVSKYLPLGHGVPQHSQMIRLLGDVNNYGGPKDVGHASAQLLAIMNQPGLIVFISDFIGFDESFEHVIRVMASRHDLIGICVRDPRDRRLPEHGEFLVSDPTSGQKLVIDAADYATPFATYVAEEEERIRSTIRRAGGDFLFLETTEPYKNLLRRAVLQRKTRWWRD
jgi:uncharacterized protein (DUF58 family)